VRGGELEQDRRASPVGGRLGKRSTEILDGALGCTLGERSAGRRSKLLDDLGAPACRCEQELRRDPLQVGARLG
jgi:hypothetical protein